MKCPRCQVLLKASDFGEYGFVIIDVCPQCKGAWFDKGELDRLDDSVWTNLEALNFQVAPADHSPANCPKCSAILTSLTLKDAPTLVLDRCPACHGFWLDAGELDKMRDVAMKEDSKVARDMTMVQRPPDWSWPRWAVYRFKQLYMSNR